MTVPGWEENSHPGTSVQVTPLPRCRWFPEAGTSGVAHRRRTGTS
ncbi:hypothetical protein Bravens_00870 [Brevibacterium ravenspurgense]|uniref:Uncharacterized protein n=1 Tax=Brevibacterium ravenspurgense TaxID=479117 RepID=A0A150H9C0_9MICO|nr:hypothetical protein Bravens_00870 [Brevibacterium ravenspurgense]